MIIVGPLILSTQAKAVNKVGIMRSSRTFLPSNQPRRSSPRSQDASCSRYLSLTRMDFEQLEGSSMSQNDSQFLHHPFLITSLDFASHCVESQTTFLYHCWHLRILYPGSPLGPRRRVGNTILVNLTQSPYQSYCSSPSSDLAFAESRIGSCWGYCGLLDCGYRK